MSLLTQTVSGLLWILYGSFFEWYYHKFWMHMPRTPREAFRGHTIVHHGLYRGDENYFVAEGEHPEHILLKPYALPLILLVHLPVVLAIEHFLVPHTAVGALVGSLLYFFTYEYCHFNMHVPRGRFIERFRWFQFLRRHHHLHHRYFQANFCVLLPLADWCMGTFFTEESLARRRAEREKAIARGDALPDRVGRRRGGSARGRVTVTQLAQMRLARLNRPSRKARDYVTLETRRFKENYRTGRPRPARPGRRLLGMLRIHRDRE